MAVKKQRKPESAGRDMKASRRAVGFNVIISLVAAAALLIVINVIGDLLSRERNLRWNVETLGRHRLSDTAKRVLEQVRQPVRLTTIYTSTDPDKKPEQYLPQLRDLLEEMRQWKKDITVVHATTDRAKAEVVARLRQRLDKAAEKHRKLIEGFQLLAQSQETLLEQEAQNWRAYPPKGYLAQFGLPKAFETYLTTTKESLRKLSIQLRQDLSGDVLPNYPELSSLIEEALEALQKALEGVRGDLNELAAFPEKAGKPLAELAETAKTVTEEIDKAVAAAGKKDSPAPSDPGQVLGKIAASAAAGADTAAKGARLLGNLNTEAASKLQNLTSWRTAAVYLTQMSSDLGNVAAHSQSVQAAVKPEVQQQFITQQLRPALPLLLQRAKDVESAVAQMTKELTEVDEPTKELFKAAKGKDFLQAHIKPVNELIERSDELGSLADWTELIEQTQEDNIVLAEIGEKTGVVTFDDVWPPAPGSEFDTASPDEQEDRRAFYGDMAICAKMLNLTAEPFAEVVLTFFEHMMPRAMGQGASVMGPIPSMWLQTLRERLENANVEVKQWNLANRDEPPEPGKGRPRVLLVLPPPEAQLPMMARQQLPQFGPEHVEKLKRVIDQGTPAVFLAGYLRPRFWGQMAPPEFGWGKYLQEDWGLNVRTDMRVVMGKRSPLAPEKFTLPILWWDFLPLSSFSEEHPAGNPLRARRFYWYTACPVSRAEGAPAEVTTRDILAAPEQTGDLYVWASAAPEQLWQRIVSGKGDDIELDTGGGDLLPPFALAMEAEKTIQDRPTRVVVLGVGLSYIDGFLTYRIPKLKSRDTLSTEPPPTGNVDLVVNCVYHVIGKDEFIGAGPAIIQRIELIKPATMTRVKIVFGIVWPAVMLLAGGVVMFIRRR